MAVYADRVKETTTTTGTGPYTVDGAGAGYQTFIAGCGAFAIATYCCEDGTDWEIGQGQVDTGSLSRSVILDSSNGGAIVSWGAGTKNIFLTAAADRTAFTDAVQTFTTNQTFNAILGVGTSGRILLNGNAQLVLADGTVGSPALQFDFDGDTGIHRALDNSVDIVARGRRAFRVLSPNTSNTDNTLVAVNALGGTSYPTISIESDVANKDIGILAKGTGAVYLNGATTNVNNSGVLTLPAGSLGSPSVSIGSNSTVGLIYEDNTAGDGSEGIAITAKATPAVPTFIAKAFNSNNANGITVQSFNGGFPDIQVHGTDTNIDLGLAAKGTGSVVFNNSAAKVNSAGVLTLPAGSNTATAINFGTVGTGIYGLNTQVVGLSSNGNRSFTVGGAGTQSLNINHQSGYTDLEIVGAGANIELDISCSGTASSTGTYFYTFASGSYRNLFSIAPQATVTGAQNFIAVGSANAGAAPLLEARGGDTNINLDLNGKGTGSIRLNGTATTVSSAGAISTTQALTHSGSTAHTVSTTGAVSFTGAVVQSTKGFAAAEFSAGSGGPGTITWSNGQNQTKTLTSSGTIAFASATVGATYKLRIVQGGSGNYTITWPAEVKWAGGAAPTLSTAIGAIDIITLYFTADIFYAQAATGFA